MNLPRVRSGDTASGWVGGDAELPDGADGTGAGGDGWGRTTTTWSDKH